MGEILSIISHQWRQPLNELGLVLQKFEFAYHKNMLTQEFLRTETQSAKNLLNKMSSTIDIFRNFLNLKKEMIDFDVVSSIKNVVTLFEETCKKEAITITLECNESTSIRHYSGEFEHVILNLLNNATEALSRKQTLDKQIYLRTQKSKNALVIELFDNAGGIETMPIDRIFNPHFSTKVDGSGIGLYICKKIIEERMNARISVSNRSFSLNNIHYVGACFEIKL